MLGKHGELINAFLKDYDNGTLNLIFVEDEINETGTLKVRVLRKLIVSRLMVVKTAGIKNNGSIVEVIST